MDTTAVKACLNTDAVLDKVKAHEAVAKTLRVDSTPTLFIGRVRKDGGVDLLRRVQGAVPANVLKDEVAKLKS